jgi:hypothetical protein
VYRQLTEFIALESTTRVAVNKDLAEVQGGAGRGPRRLPCKQASKQQASKQASKQATKMVQ